MTALLMQDVFDTTSTSTSFTDTGSLVKRPFLEVPLLLGLLVSGIGTSAYANNPYVDITPPSFAASDCTTTGRGHFEQASARSAIGELRRISGLTWDQLAHLFNVSRRSLHFWASGKPMTTGNEEHLHLTLAALRHIDRGSSALNRRLLLEPSQDGELPLQLLANRHYARVRVLLGQGGSRPTPTQGISEAANQARAPLPPEVLVGALQDRIHREEGKTRIAKSVRVRSGS